MEALKLKADYSKFEEREIIHRILSGEKNLYELLVRRNNQKLYRMIRAFLKEEEDIEDIMQNSYLKAFEKLYQFKLESSFSTWLLRIAINESLARLKEKKKKDPFNQNVNDLNQNFILEIPDLKQINPQNMLVKKEMKLILEHAIDQLPTKYKTVYILREVEEMGLNEIALTLDLSIANVKVRIHRAKDQLKTILMELSTEKEIFEFGFHRCDRITENVLKNL